MGHIFEDFPTRERILDFSYEQLANRLLQDLSGNSLNRHNFVLRVNEVYGSDQKVEQAFLRAWAILASRGYLVEKAEPGWFFVSDLGEKEKKQTRLEGIPPPKRAREIAGRWIVDRELSSGGQGVTSIVRLKDGSDQTLFVLKEMRNASNEKARRRFAKEAEALAELAHPNILKVIDSEIDASPPWYVSEYCAAGGLDRASLPDLPLRTRLSLFLDVCRALTAAHQKRITHRDIKPENVFLRSPTGPALVGDFGLCYFVESDEGRLTATHEDIGSSFCRAPELFDGPVETVVPTADVYCLGKLLYWLVVGKGGLAGRIGRENFEQGGKNLVSIFNNPSYEHINVVLRRMISADPDSRFQNAGQVYVACEKSFDLLLDGYQPLNRAPGRCQYCGRGEYRRKREGYVTATEHSMMSSWCIYECAICGHSLFFRKGPHNEHW